MTKQTKVVVFDFDGTLTHRNYNIWKRIWLTLGYDIGENSYYRELFKKFMAEEITHQEWCNLTCDAYRRKGMNKSMLEQIVSDIELLDGADTLFEKLKNAGYKLYIVSGNIKDAIEMVLGDSKKYFKGIMANDLVFSKTGELKKIVGTQFDFEGKLHFLNSLIVGQGINPKDITFVGNGSNDEWAHESGCNTICINPEPDVDVDNEEKWHKVMIDIDNLTDLLPVIDEKFKDNDKVEVSK